MDVVSWDRACEHQTGHERQPPPIQQQATGIALIALAAAGSVATVATATPAAPQGLGVACPFGLVDDPFPGRCKRYRDNDGNRYCDFSVLGSGSMRPRTG